MDQIVTQVINIHHARIVIIGPRLVTNTADTAILLIGGVVPSGLLKV